MKLYIKQKVFSWGDKFAVKDENGDDRYFVEGELFSWGKKLHVYDTNRTEVVFIQQKVFSLLPKFFVFVNGEQVAEIVKEFTFLKQKYSVAGLGWTVEGNFIAHEFKVLSSNEPIVSITKKWFTWGDSYELDIVNQRDEQMALAVVLAIDAVMAQNSKSNR